MNIAGPMVAGSGSGFPCRRARERARKRANARSLFNCGCSITVSCDLVRKLSLSYIVVNGGVKRGHWAEQ